MIGEESKNSELRMPQENKEQCVKSAKTFRFSLPVISMETRCEPRRDDEEPEMKEISVGRSDSYLLTGTDHLPVHSIPTSSIIPGIQTCDHLHTGDRRVPWTVLGVV